MRWPTRRTILVYSELFESGPLAITWRYCVAARELISPSLTRLSWRRPVIGTVVHAASNARLATRVNFLSMMRRRKGMRSGATAGAVGPFGYAVGRPLSAARHGRLYGGRRGTGSTPADRRAEKPVVGLPGAGAGA